MNPYLNFDGNAEEAFNFYKSVFGVEFQSISRFKDMPQEDKPLPEDVANRIMHISLPIGNDQYLMASDIFPGMEQNFIVGTNVKVALLPDSKEEGERLFNALSEGGRVEMPFEKVFWGDYYGALTDKFGIQWMINYAEPK